MEKRDLSPKTYRNYWLTLGIWFALAILSLLTAGFATPFTSSRVVGGLAKAVASFFGLLALIFFLVFAAVWYGGSLLAFVGAKRKKRLPDVGGTALLLLLVFGWWALFIIAVGGGLWVFFASRMQPVKIYPFCKSKIPVDAVRCPHCAGVV